MKCIFSAGIQSGKRPQAGTSATQGGSALGGESQSGRGSLLPGFAGVSQPRKASDAIGKTGKQPAQGAAMSSYRAKLQCVVSWAVRSTAVFVVYLHSANL